MERRFRVPAGVHTRQVGEELVILDATGGEYYSLDAIGAVVFREASAGRSLGEIVETLASAYEVSRERLEQDVRALVETLGAKGLLQPIP